MDIDFNYLSSLIKNNSGIVLEKDKQYLIESRLYPVAKKHNFNNIAELVMSVKSSNNAAMICDIIEAMTTHETLFFRDVKVFNKIRDYIIPAIKSSDGAITKIKIWSAASSSGQEAYSLAMMFMENTSFGLDCEIFGTDLSKKIIEKAQKGEFTQFEVQRGLPITLLMKYFTSSTENWYISDEVKKKVKFAEFNLLNDINNLPEKGFHIVCLRNVLIYFDSETKAKILNNIAKVLLPKGYLVLGTADTVMGAEDKYTLVPDSIGIYQLK